MAESTKPKQMRKRNSDLISSSESSSSVPVVDCDICDERKLKALKSCLVCQASYCETHLEPHHRVPNFMKHKLMDPVVNIKDYICQKHERPLELFCRDDQMCICLFCTEGDHRTHHTASLKEESKQKMTKLMKLQTFVQQMIQDRMNKIKDIQQNSAEFRNRSTDREKASSVDLCSALMGSIERCQTELLEMLEEKQKAVEKEDEELIGELQQEITDLEMKNNELDHLAHTEDQLQLLEIFPSICKPLHTRNWPGIRMNTDVSVEALRRALTQLKENLDQKLDLTVLMKMQQYAVNVILDPDTAAPDLILSDDGKHVSVRTEDTALKPMNNPERFISYGVVGKEGFSSGRFYFEVLVKEIDAWVLGVVRKSVERKQNVQLCPENGFWTVALWYDSQYSARSDPPVPLSVKPQKVGVFVDYEKGLVSFYDVESRSHIYSFTGQKFSEELYPLLGYLRQNKHNKTAQMSILTINNS